MRPNAHDLHPPRPRRRALVRRLAALLLPLAAACAQPERAPMRTAADVELERAWDGVRALAERNADSLSNEEVIALGYVERLRLGLGSPFRLMDHALQDPRLLPAARTRTAAALLHATRGGHAYAVDARALAMMGADSAGRAEPALRTHLALIAGAVAAADDPRAGELAVRAAYQLAAAEHLVAPMAPVLAAQAAALARDRALARRDAERLLAEADSAARHPLALLREWRAARRFEVEAPGGAARPPYLEVRASALALPLADGIRDAARGIDAEPGELESMPRLSPTAARRLAAIARAQNGPPSAPIRITLDRYRGELRREMAGTRDGRAAADRLVLARTEERFAAELARAAGDAEAHGTPALVALEAAVALRAYAQEAVWFPGFPAPGDADLKRAYGLAAIRFDADVPVHWRGYYRRMLGESLADLESVLPGLDLHGLSFRVGGTGMGGSALAVHYPHSRAIHIPPGTGPGSIAHEVAHDLDWQVGRTRYGRRGAYGTDLAVHRGDADHFAAAVRLLPLNGPRIPSPEGRRYDARPAEAFARLFDGYVTATLAARGRSNGALSSLQDEVLTGHGTAVAPDARGEAAEAFLPLLMVASPMTADQAAAFRLRWGALRSPGPLALLADVAASASGGAAAPPAAQWHSLVDRASLDASVRERIARVERERDEALRTRAVLVCANPFLSPLADGETAVRALLHAAADARIRGILRRFAHARGIDAAPDVLRATWVDAPPSAATAGVPASLPSVRRGAGLAGCGRV